MSDLVCFLVGPNGCGKTAVGRILANFLSIQFIDSDQQLERTTGKTITKLWQEVGEDNFYQLERELLYNIINKNNIIVATNATSILTEDNRNLFSTYGKTIYLAANPINQYTRIMLSGRQPPLLVKVENKLGYLMNLESTMDPLYHLVADFVVATDHCGIEEVVNKIIDYLHCRAYCV